MGPDDYREQLSRLQPGDRLLLKFDDYRQGLPLHELSGRSGQPIFFKTLDTSAPMLRFIARSGANTVSLINVQYLVLLYLELDGRNVQVDAIKAEGHAFADVITLERIFIHDQDASQQNVGISTCAALGWLVKNHRIQRVGTGKCIADPHSRPNVLEGISHSQVWEARTVTSSTPTCFGKTRAKPCFRAREMSPYITIC